jgi:hypothetical protein
VTRVKASVVPGFVHDGHFYTRDETAAMLASAAQIEPSLSPERSLRQAA